MYVRTNYFFLFALYNKMFEILVSPQEPFFTAVNRQKLVCFGSITRHDTKWREERMVEWSVTISQQRPNREDLPGSLDSCQKNCLQESFFVFGCHVSQLNQSCGNDDDDDANNNYGDIYIGMCVCVYSNQNTAPNNLKIGLQEQIFMANL